MLPGRTISGWPLGQPAPVDTPSGLSQNERQTGRKPSKEDALISRMQSVILILSRARRLRLSPEPGRAFLGAGVLSPAGRDFGMFLGLIAGKALITDI